MRHSKQCFLSITFLLLAVLTTATHAAAQSGMRQERVVANFTGNGFVGSSPIGGLISDAAGNFYGVTQYGGIKGNIGGSGLGTVYEVSPTVKGGWSAKSIYLFQPGTHDGQYPVGGLVMDSSGNLYGTTQDGGTHLCTDNYYMAGCGTVFELSPNGSGGWSEKIIYNFSESEGWLPNASMIMDSAGNLYGVTEYGGIAQLGGTAFELRRNGGEWTHHVLHSFGQAGSGDGARPSGALVFDSAGNLYGTTFIGGAGSQGNGVVFELTETQSGWKESILFDFNSGSSGASGVGPIGGLIFDSAGNLYGTTVYGGTGAGDGCGTAFELTPTNGGAWNETVVHEFLCNQYGVAWPEAGLVLDAAGNLYGTTALGSPTDTGNVFELKRSADSAWTYFVIYTFQGSPSDGSGPNSSLLLDSKGSLYGTTAQGGPSGGGTLFEIMP